MRTLLEAALLQDESIQKATSAYIEDICITEGVASMMTIREHLARFGLMNKDPESLKNSACMLGLEVWEEHGSLVW